MAPKLKIAKRSLDSPRVTNTDLHGVSADITNHVTTEMANMLRTFQNLHATVIDHIETNKTVINRVEREITDVKQQMEDLVTATRQNRERIAEVSVQMEANGKSLDKTLAGQQVGTASAAAEIIQMNGRILTLTADLEEIKAITDGLPQQIANIEEQQRRAIEESDNKTLRHFTRMGNWLNDNIPAQ